MISYDIVYLRPSSIAEAVEAWRQTSAEGLEPAYLGGGTELLTMARDNRRRPGALIDLKRIEELRAITDDGAALSFGSSLRLNDLCTDSRFALLAEAADRIADHSVRNSITLGGNVCGMLPYREAVLPFLAADGTATIAGSAPGGGPGGLRTVPLSRLFNKRLVLEPGEFLVALSVSLEAARAPHRYRRRERDGRIDYPLLTLCSVATGGAPRLALSGVYAYPLRSAEAEAALGGSGDGAAARAAAFVDALPNGIRNDLRGSADYRRALLLQAVEDALTALGGEP